MIKLLRFIVFTQVSEKEMDHIIARSTHRDKISRNRHSSHSQGLIFYLQLHHQPPLFTPALQSFTDLSVFNYNGCNL